MSKEDDCPPIGERVARLEVKMNIIAAIASISLAVGLATLLSILIR